MLRNDLNPYICTLFGLAFVIVNMIFTSPTSHAEGGWLQSEAIEKETVKINKNFTPVNKKNKIEIVPDPTPSLGIGIAFKSKWTSNLYLYMPRPRERDTSGFLNKNMMIIDREVEALKRRIADLEARIDKLFNMGLVESTYLHRHGHTGTILWKSKQ